MRQPYSNRIQRAVWCHMLSRSANLEQEFKEKPLCKRLTIVYRHYGAPLPTRTGAVILAVCRHYGARLSQDRK